MISWRRAGSSLTWRSWQERLTPPDFTARSGGRQVNCVPRSFTTRSCGSKALVEPVLDLLRNLFDVRVVLVDRLVDRCDENIPIGDLLLAARAGMAPVELDDIGKSVGPVREIVKLMPEQAFQNREVARAVAGSEFIESVFTFIGESA